MRIKTRLNAALLLAAIMATACSDTPPPSEPAVVERPNIIFMMSDDHAYQAISAYGSELIDTPNIDQLAAEGMLFTRATVANAICAPSRASILTGKHSHMNGKVDNVQPFDETQVTFPQLLQAAGYQTAMFGKLHFGNNPKGVDDFMILPGQGSYINPDFITPEGDVRLEGYVTDLITDVTINWLDQKRDKAKPFFLAYLHKAPHRPWWPRADKFAKFYGREYPLPSTLADDYSTRGTAAKTAEMRLLDHMRYSHDSKIRPETYHAMEQVEPAIPPSSWGFSYPYSDRVNDEQRAAYEPTLDKINQDFQSRWPTMTDREKLEWKYQRYMQDYLATIESVDENVGRLMDYLKAEGLDKNTIIVYTSDNGFFLGEHGWFDKRFAYQESLQVPLIVRWPGVTPAGKKSAALVQNIDYAPTFLAAAGLPVPEDIQGQSLLPLLTDQPAQWSREALYYHYYAYPAIHSVKRHYAIITERYKLIHFYHDVDEWELYDLAQDPQELNNLIGQPEQQALIEDLKSDLKDLRAHYQDSEQLDQYFIQRSADDQHEAFE
ncbi:sulfatase family protein [Simiduia agarivorans]|uniref:Sulfatase n=1 Tax=Simiduia agarivorans (strain DSM 21679 / JCM 13881 / BCRC 17597 / SA1) TaxID=1117647 RepID=K4L2L0_SIMAS|nr:sulfatase [Simiduia agarivorans]AFV00433.1 sulfatase [Simiduia agarivorans SA1 = DSM 21679]